jgi:hypothetical protein
MFAKSRIIRLASWGCLAVASPPIGSGLLEPSQAKAGEVIRVGPIVRPGPIVRVEPVVPVIPIAPVVTVGPVVRFGPTYPQPWFHHYETRGWFGYHWHR